LNTAKNCPPGELYYPKDLFPIRGIFILIKHRKRKGEKRKNTSKSQSFAIVNADVIEITVLHNF